MKTTGVIFNVIILSVMVSLLCVWFYPSVEHFVAANRMWNGARNFIEVFNADEIDSLAALPSMPESTALVAIPYLDYSEADLSRIKEYVENGGILLLMDDYGYGNRILEYLGIRARFTGDVLLDPLFNYRNQYLPRVTDFSPSVNQSGIDVVLFNYATTLAGVSDTTVIAWSSAESYLDLNDNGALDNGEPEGPFPVVAELGFGRGRMILVSDPSIIINTMVDRDDNLKFVSHLLSSNRKIELLLFDTSHLSTAPLDVSKAGMINIREVFSRPYPVVIIVALIFIGLPRFTLKKGENVV